MSQICYIIGAGDNFKNDLFYPDDDDLVIAADGGYKFLKKNNIRTDIILGDFDSLDKDIEMIGSQIIKLNPVKDETDTLYAINKGIEKGYKIFKIYGGTGGRTDHTISNMQSLCMLAKKNMQGFLYTEKEIITVIHNNSLSFDKTQKGYISVFSLDTESYGINETGLKYSLENYTMSNSYPIGVSNEFIGKESTISVDNGTLMIIYPRN